MTDYLIMLGVVIIAVYTALFGIETFKEKNYLGFAAIIALSITIVALPIYVLFFYGG